MASNRLPVPAPEVEKGYQLRLPTEFASSSVKRGPDRRIPVHGPGKEEREASDLFTLYISKNAAVCHGGGLKRKFFSFERVCWQFFSG